MNYIKHISRDESYFTASYLFQLSLNLLPFLSLQDMYIEDFSMLEPY